MEYVGIIVRGINNIYSVIKKEEFSTFSHAKQYYCRIKGKRLHTDDTYYPLAVGDYVLFSVHQKDEGLIIERLPRNNSFERWNAKKSCNQTLVANMDLLICVTSTDDPPFRPRFIDRAIVCAHNLDILIVLNKCDLPLTESEYERFSLYSTLGFSTCSLSAFDQHGVEKLLSMIRHKTCALIGQSGVGKSTLVNALIGGESLQKTGEISQKYHRGKHTTNHSVMLFGPDCIIVDTPGIRELLVPHDDPTSLSIGFPEFRKYDQECQFNPCLHDHEPGCKIKQLVEEEKIHPDRYESYLRMIDSLDERPESWEMERT